MPSDGLTQALPKWSLSFKLKPFSGTCDIKATMGLTIGLCGIPDYFSNKAYLFGNYAGQVPDAHLLTCAQIYGFFV